MIRDIVPQFALFALSARGWGAGGAGGGPPRRYPLISAKRLRLPLTRTGISRNPGTRRPEPKPKKETYLFRRCVGRSDLRPPPSRFRCVYGGQGSGRPKQERATELIQKNEK